MRAYYDQRAREYDDWWLGTGLFARRDRPGWNEEVSALIERVRGLPPRRTLDVACGTGFLTRHLPGEVTALDQSEAMISLLRRRFPSLRTVRADAVPLFFADRAFERIVTSHFYGHLLAGERQLFLAEARRVAGELVVIDSARRDDLAAEEWQERTLNDGTTHRVYKRFFEASDLSAELGGGEVLHAGRWFVAVVA